MKQVTDLSYQQAERNTKLETERHKTIKVNARETHKEGGEQRTSNPASAYRNQQIISEIRQMKSAISELQGRGNDQGCQEVRLGSIPIQVP